MYLGIDLGTSGVKAVLLDGDDRIAAQSAAPLGVSTPRPRWSEQDPRDWWAAACRAVDGLKAEHGGALSAVRAIGLSGQMHGATLLDARGGVLRPAILWNDGRANAECAGLEARAPDSRRITGNLAMPGFTAPKLLWVAAHEPEVFARVAKVLLPKDYLRYRMSGEYVAEMSDAWTSAAAAGRRRCSPPPDSARSTCRASWKAPSRPPASRPRSHAGGAWRARWSSRAAPGTTRRARPGSEPWRRGAPSCLSAPPGCSSPRIAPSRRTRNAPCTPSATASRTRGIGCRSS